MPIISCHGGIAYSPSKTLQGVNFSSGPESTLDEGISHGAFSSPCCRIPRPHTTAGI